MEVFRDIWIAMRCPFLLTEKFLIPLQLTKSRHNGRSKVVKLYRASNSSFGKKGPLKPVGDKHQTRSHGKFIAFSS